MEHRAPKAAVISIEEAGANLSRIVAEVEADPRRAYEIDRQGERAAVILNRTTFERLVEAAEEAVDVRGAAEALATEPLTSVAAYHARRLERRAAGR